MFFLKNHSLFTCLTISFFLKASRYNIVFLNCCSKLFKITFIFKNSSLMSNIYKAQTTLKVPCLFCSNFFCNTSFCLGHFNVFLCQPPAVVDYQSDSQPAPQGQHQGAVLGCSLNLQAELVSAGLLSKIVYACPQQADPHSRALICYTRHHRAFRKLGAVAAAHFWLIKLAENWPDWTGHHAITF